MKKLFLISVIVFGVLTAANAQFYMGAGFGINSSGASSSSTSSFGVNLSPELGFIISPKVNLGVNLSLDVSGTGNSSNNYATATANYEFAPYVRFGIINYNNFALQLQGDVFVSSYSKATTSNNNTEIVDSNVSFGLRVAPRLSYDISRHFTLFTKLNFLGLKFATVIDPDDDNVRVDFNLSGNTSNIISVSGLSIGALYVF
jgi:hypothetical protein